LAYAKARLGAKRRSETYAFWAKPLVLAKALVALMPPQIYTFFKAKKGALAAPLFYHIFSFP